MLIMTSQTLPEARDRHCYKNRVFLSHFLRQFRDLLCLNVFPLWHFRLCFSCVSVQNNMSCNSTPTPSVSLTIVNSATITPLLNYTTFFSRQSLAIAKSFGFPRSSPKNIIIYANFYAYLYTI